MFYWVTLFISLFAFAAYFTGPGTAEWIKTKIDLYPQQLVENHALWGRFGFIGSVLSGIFALMAIMNYTQGEIPHKSIPWILSALLIINFLIYIYTAHLGGMIRREDLFFNVV